MVRHDVQRATVPGQPVLDEDGRPVGIVSEHDVLPMLAGLLRQAPDDQERASERRTAWSPAGA
ncbi:MAG: hypothetical protein L0271_15140 [Gemmatimonadetes bacterium]|nr:hypothetical protein [Gemmatimonadota bacterium]